MSALAAALGFTLVGFAIGAACEWSDRRARRRGEWASHVDQAIEVTR